MKLYIQEKYICVTMFYVLFELLKEVMFVIQHGLSRMELIIGTESLKDLRNKKVVVLGLGGVGSYTVEALARCGIGHIVLVDDDTVCLTNLNRQIHALYNTIGKFKTSVMKERIESISKKIKITEIVKTVTKDNISDFIDNDTHYVIDALDTISAKIALAEYCEKNNIPLISCMGTGNKLDPTQFKITDIYKTKNCPLCKVMRYELRKRGVKKLKVVFSEEIPKKPKLDEVVSCINGCVCNFDNGRSCTNRRQIPGSISFVPPVAGFILAGEVINTFLDKKYD